MLNGGPVVVNAISRGAVPTTLSFGNTTQGGAFPAPGDYAEIGYWNTFLSVGEGLLLSQGVSPLLVRKENLAAYWPLNTGDPYYERSFAPSDSPISANNQAYALWCTKTAAGTYGPLGFVDGPPMRTMPNINGSIRRLWGVHGAAPSGNRRRRVLLCGGN